MICVLALFPSIADMNSNNHIRVVCANNITMTYNRFVFSVVKLGLGQGEIFIFTILIATILDINS